MAGVFLSGEEKKDRAMAMTFLGAALFVAAGLGLIDVLYPEKGGLVGRWMGALENPFGYTASIIITITILLAAFLLTLNIPIKIIRRREERGEKEPEPEIIIRSPESFPAAPKAEELKAEPEKKKEEENPKAFFTPRKPSVGKIKNYTPPPLALLKSSIEKPTSGDLRANANIIKRTLDSFGIPVEMGEISIGPKVTRYTLKPA